ncbi:MAG: SRPBCC domain-containing protein [Planctomycetes bacterium]|nr:SRPBCC domain-containing protein [Planctomycetota bacterium]
MSARNLAVTQNVWLRAAPAKVWAALTRGPRIARWYTRGGKMQLRRGGTWNFRGGESTGRVLELRRNARFVHTQKDDPGYPETKIEYTITKLGRNSKLEIRHSNFRGNKEVYGAWVRAWPVIACNLKTYLETGKPMWEGTWA